LKTRLLAYWRASAWPDRAGHSLALVFRNALMCAAAVMLATVIWSYKELAFDPQNDVAVANFELREDVMP
jgi:hypothetical protein